MICDECYVLKLSKSVWNDWVGYGFWYTAGPVSTLCGMPGGQIQSNTVSALDRRPSNRACVRPGETNRD